MLFDGEGALDIEAVYIPMPPSVDVILCMTYELTGLSMFLRLSSSCLDSDRTGITIGRDPHVTYDGTKVYLIY